MQSAVLRFASSMACAYVSSVVDTSECPNIPATVSASTPFESKIEAAEWRKRCGLMCGRSWRLQNSSSSRFTVPGFIGAPSHFVKTRLLFFQRSPNFNRSSACLARNLRKSSAVSFGIATLRLFPRHCRRPVSDGEGRQPKPQSA